MDIWRQEKYILMVKIRSHIYKTHIYEIYMKGTEGTETEQNTAR